METYTFKIKDYLERAGNSRAAGDAVFKDARPIIERGGSIIMDLEGVIGLSSVFMNPCFGFLMDIFGVERVKESFKFRHVLKTQGELIRNYFNYYEPEQPPAELLNKFPR